MEALSIPMPVRSSVRIGRWPLVLAAALAVGVVARWVSGFEAPLTFDETFSGVIATQPDFPRLLHWCLTELSGPAYYMPLWVWVRLFGDSDAALRTPPMLLSLLAPLAVLRWTPAPVRVRRIWALLLLLWLPGVSLANEARPYAQIVALATLQAVAFLRLIAAPTRRRALLWVALCGALLLTHYYTAAICAAQGIAYLLRHGRRALATWPAMFALLPVFAWMSVHLPMVLGYAGGSGAHYALLGWRDLALLPLLLFGGVLPGTVLLAAIALTARPHWRDGLERKPGALLVASGAAAFALVLGLGFVLPFFAPRYLLSCMPALLFGVAGWAGQERVRATALVAMLLLLDAGLIRDGLRAPDHNPRADHPLGLAAAWLLERPLDRLVFYWDGAVVEHAPGENLAQIAQFAFQRAGRPVAVTVVRVPPGADANATVLAAAGGMGAVGIIWRTSDVKLDPRYRSGWPRPAALAARFDCRPFAPVGLIACRSR